MSLTVALLALPILLGCGDASALATLEYEVTKEAVHYRGWPGHTCFVQLVLVTAWTGYLAGMILHDYWMNAVHWGGKA